ncbi:hypothetical protein [Microbacterium karelineae]|uniref:hypothetical protein n=1 Tax=Microbacterium karelineae TaxID=2654283 RepID=UPI0012EA9F2F|nr:hypothetical protein [Microbacterium karelineae]
MSDAQGSRNDGGEPVEEQADGAASVADERDAPEQAPVAEQSDEMTDAGAPDDAGEASGSGDASDAEPSGDAPTEANAAASDEGSTAEASPAEETDTRAADDEGGAPTDSADEPDYEALAAELDRLESETATAAPVAPGAREPEGVRKPGDPWFEPATNETFMATEPQPGATTPIDEPETVAVTASEPAPHVAPAPGPIFVQAPEPPRRRGNRGASGLIGLLAAVVFAALYAAVTYGWNLFESFAETRESVVDPLTFVTDVLLQPPFWFTVVAFWLAFWLLGVFVNRARWWSWVVLGLFVALLTYAGYIGGVFLDQPFWVLTADEGFLLLVHSVFAVPALLAFIVAREVTIWFGGWVSRRGARITKQNAAEREEYDRLMAEGPQAPAKSA